MNSTALTHQSVCFAIAVLNFSNPSATAATVRVDVALPTAVSSYPTIGTWCVRRSIRHLEEVSL